MNGLTESQILRKHYGKKVVPECNRPLAPTPRVCPICGCGGTPWVHTAAVNIKECGACQLAFSDRTWLDSASLYTGNGYHLQYFSQEPYLRSVFSRMLKEVETITTGRRLYEVGCGVGILLDEARKRGYEVSGIEYSPGAARTAQERFGIVIEEGSFSPPDAGAARAGAYDIVVVNHVLEHVDDPVAMLKGVGALLRPGGVLVVGVPDAADLWTRLSVWFGHYNVLAPEQHLWHFRQLSLDRLHRLAGLVPVRWLHMNRKLGATSWKELVRSITVMIGSILGRHGALVCYSQAPPVESMTQGIAHVGLADARNRRARPFAPVSAVILTHNNEDTVEACLRSLMFCHERIVVDSGSTDSTIELCERYGAKVFGRKLDAFDAQRNFGAGMASFPWILAMDSDEEISPGLAEEITLMVSSNPSENGFGFLLVNHFLGRPMPHRSGLSGHGARLYRRERGRFVGEVHERVLLDGQEGLLKGSALHYCQRSISSVIRSYNDYTDREAAGRVASCAVIRDLIYRPLKRLAGHYVIRGGWRQGTHGFIKCVLDSFYLFLVAAKEWERKQSAR